MKIVAWIALSGSLLFSTCKQTDPSPAACNPAPITVQAPAAEVTALKAYLDANAIAATADSRGFYYTIQTAGNGAKPTVCSTVTVNYAGKLTDNTTFDSNNGITFGLDRLIVGWQEGIPLIAPGGRITLYLPPSLAYGARAVGSIPANSILVFDIDLVRVQ